MPLTSFERRSMGVKFTTVFLLVILIPMSILAYFSFRVLDARLMHEAEEELSMALKIATTDYFSRGEQMRYGMLQAASMEEIKKAVERRDKAYLRKTMIEWKRLRPYVDIWAVADAEGVVIARLNSEVSGDEFQPRQPVAAAIERAEPVISTEVLYEGALRAEGAEVVEKVSVPGEQRTTGSHAGVEGMALTVATPVFDPRGRAIGAIITADLHNNDNHIPESMSAKNRDIFASLSLKGKRISTNLADGSGRSLKNAMLPEEILSAMRAGGHFSGEWAEGAFITKAEPLKSLNGEPIGALDVSMSKSHIWDLQKESQQVIGAAAAIGIGFSLLAALLSTYRITRPLKTLKERLSGFAAGDLSTRIEVSSAGSSDEIAILSTTFNSMLDEVSMREKESKRYLAEIERKNSELKDLNDTLKGANEELEVAYEETQSQTEELHAINEELKLLNEDLDRKNSELQKANELIRKEEEELKRAKDKLRLIFDSISDHLMLVDYDGRIIEVNRHFAESFKTGESAVEGKMVSDFFGLEPYADDCPVRQSIDARAPVERELTARDGKIYHLRAFPFMEGIEPANRAVLYVKDVTEQRLFAQKLIQTDKLSSLGELVSGVAHELNNPLTGIMCFSELLIEAGLDEKSRDKIRKINEATHRCKKIIDNLLTFARWRRPEKRYQSLNKLIRDSVELRSYQLRMDNVEIDLALDDSIPDTMLDDNQIQQVFLNLVNNARDAIKEKGVEGRIRITSSASSGKVVATVEDNGAGFKSEVSKRIFDPFFTTKEVGKGTGLGLSISYGIINEHGGAIYASSVPGSGTTFTIELPVVENALQGGFFAGPGQTPGATRQIANGLKALIIDDEPMIVELLNESLSSMGFDVEIAGSAIDALERIKTGSYGVIISDIKMPGLDGKGLHAKVKESRPDALGRLIFITGDSVNKDTQDFLSKAGNIALRKPFTVEELGSTVKGLLSGPPVKGV